MTRAHDIDAHRSRSPRSLPAVLVMVAGIAGWPVTVHAAEPSTVTARAPLPSRDAQERARAMARELVASSLDGQLRQLEDNGLEQLPVHAEIQAMRGNIEALVSNEMQGVADLLAKADSAQPDDQAAAVQEARRLIRHITVRLSAERQMVLRRLKVADIAAQVRRLVAQQSSGLRLTESLPQEPAGRREAVTLTALEQQRTVGSLYDVLVASLGDVRAWDGPLGAAATESLRRLRDGQADAAVKAAEDRLAGSDFAAAATAQRQVLDLLAALEQRIERSQGVGSSRTDAAVAAVRDMESRRRELRSEIAKAAPTDAAIEALVEKQAALRQDLNTLDDVAASDPELSPLVQTAKEAALASTEKLFQGDTQQAVAEEGKVLGSLAEIADRLTRAAPEAAGAQSAEQLAEQVERLRKAATQMPPAAPARQLAETAVVDAARTQAATKIAELSRAAEVIERAAATERELARAAERAATNPGQPSPEPAAVRAEQEKVAAVADKVADAIRSIAPAAAAAVEKARPPIANNEPEQAAAELVRAAAEIRREAAETARELVAQTQTQRQQADAALESAEAHLATQPSGDPQAAAERAAVNRAIRAAELAREQVMAETIVAQAAAQEKAREAIAELGDTITAAAAAADRTSQPQSQRQPREGEPPAEAARAAAAALERAEAQFAEAQQAIGEEAAAIAGQHEIANESLREAIAQASRFDAPSPAQKPAQQGMKPSSPAADEPAPLGTGFVPESPEATAEMIAGSEVQAAAEAILADAMQGEAAERDASDGASMAGHDPSRNTLPEPQSAEQLAQHLASLKRAATAMQSSDPARQEAAQAIDDMERAEAATKVAELARAAEAIDRAAAVERELAHAAEQAAADPGQPQPDAGAVKAEQEKVAAVAEKVAEAIRSTAAGAAEAVEKAKAPIEANKPAEAAEELAKAAAAIRREAVETASTLARGQEARLQEARDQAREEARGGQEAAPPAQRPTAPEQAAGQDERIAELARGKALADRLASEMSAQQQARDAIAERSAELKRQSDATNADGTGPAQEAAQALRQAQEDFSAAERAAGETAAALAGQNDLANQPLREGLEKASQFDASPPGALGTGFVPESPEATGEMIAGSEAEAAAEQLLGPAPDRGPKDGAMAEGSGQSSQPGSPQPPSPAGKPEGRASESASRSDQKPARDQGARQGEAKSDEPLKPVDRIDKTADGTGERSGDADQAATSLEQESWFAKLPPEMRQAIRARSHRRAPRSYEKKLDRYFRNID